MVKSQISLSGVHKLLSYLCDFTQAVTKGLFIGCIGTHEHGRQVTSIFSQSDVIM